MSCILVGLTAIKVEPETFSTSDLVWCCIRDVALISAHTTLLVLYGSEQCLHDDSGFGKGPASWLMLDVTLSGLRLIKNTIHYAANRSLERSGSQWQNPVSSNWSYVHNTIYGHICGIRIFTIVDWFTYIAWIFGISTVRNDPMCTNPIAVTVQWELTIATVVYFTCIVLFATLFLLNKTSMGFCFPGFSVDKPRWPDACPTLRIDRSLWRASSESISDYRARRTAIFIHQNPVTQQPSRMPPISTNTNLSEEELGQLRTFVYSDSILMEPSTPKLAHISPNSHATPFPAIIVITEDKSGAVTALPTATTTIAAEHNPAVVRSTGASRDTLTMAAHNSSTTPDHVLISEVELVQYNPSNKCRALLTSSKATIPGGAAPSQLPSGTDAPDQTSMTSVLDKSEEPTQERTTDRTCALCLADYEDGERLRELHCIHRFHANCVDEWLLQGRRTCPVCNQDALGVSPDRLQTRAVSHTVTNPTALFDRPPWFEDRTRQPNSNVYFTAHLTPLHMGHAESNLPAHGNSGASETVTSSASSASTMPMLRASTGSHIDSQAASQRNLAVNHNGGRLVQWFRSTGDAQAVVQSNTPLVSEMQQR
ncbi:hypothetical protein BSLG_009681 [Batrachochytrium salamandrivorans]|nr:hypothetical protein BSLG_009681 [Batrachochytrium salamandrivorans]